MSGPAKWSLGDEAPEPQDVPLEPKQAPKDVKPSETHTGTDPLGRAVGPAEDHKKIKPVLNNDGKKVTPHKDGTVPGNAKKK
jgi:hypothetical protein